MPQVICYLKLKDVKSTHYNSLPHKKTNSKFQLKSNLNYSDLNIMLKAETT